MRNFGSSTLTGLQRGEHWQKTKENGGYPELPEAKPLKARLQVEQAKHLAQVIHLIMVPLANGFWVVGNSHVSGVAAWKIKT